MSRTFRAAILIGLAVAAIGFAAVPAQADHHFIKIREFFPGTAAMANDSFLELQMYEAGQNQLGGHEIHVYDAAAVPDVYVFNPGIVIPNGDNQRTVLVGASNVPGRDSTENMDVSIDPAGGAVCFVSAEGFGVIDCVEWGSGNGTVSAGNPVLPGGIPDGQSVTRSITLGCPTLLEAGDDTDDSATDFAATSPTPRNNLTVPTETACPPAPGGGDGPGADIGPPDTTITDGPSGKTKKKLATFAFSGTDARVVASFECRLDNGGFQPCTSPFSTKVKKGKHEFAVRAIDAAGNVDSTPATQSWKVKKKKKKK